MVDGDSLIVAYSLDGGVSWSYSQILKVFKGGDDILASGQNEVIDLSPIGTETNVAFAFYAASWQSGNDIDLFLDNVKVGASSAFDMEATSVISPKGVININSSPVKVVYSNKGLNTISDGKYYVKILDESSSLIYADSSAFSNSATNQVDTVSFTQASFPSNGNYTLISKVKSSQDLNHANDSLVLSFNISMSTNNLVVVYDNSNEKELENKVAVFSALNSLSMPFDSLDRSLATPNLTPWQNVIWCEESEIPTAERASIINFLNEGTTNSQKTLLIAGDDIGFNHGRIGQAGYDSVFYNYYLHAKFFADDENVLIQNSSIIGEDVNNGLRDSLFSFFPDAIGVNFGSVPAYRFAEISPVSDTVAGVSFNGGTYNVIYYSFEFREIATNVSPKLKQLISGSLDWLSNAAGQMPVELVSFNASVLDNAVSLNWTTATEKNNSGFAIERKENNGNYKQITFISGKGSTTERSIYSFQDKNLNPGTYVYRLRQVDFDGSFQLSNETSVDISIPNNFVLEQNYPNPFNPTTKIKYRLPDVGTRHALSVQLKVYDILGNEIATLVNEAKASGSYEVTFNASGLATGMYVYKLQAGSFTSIRKMMVIK